MTQVPNLNKWPNTKKNLLPIGRHIRLRLLSNNGVSLGLKSNGQWRFQQTMGDLIRFIKTHPISERRRLIEGYEQSLSLQYIKNNFVYWNDVKNDLVWQQSIELHLMKMKYDLLQQMKGNDTLQLQNNTDITLNRSQQEELIHKYKQQEHEIESLHEIISEKTRNEQYLHNQIQQMEQHQKEYELQSQQEQPLNPLIQHKLISLKQSLRKEQCKSSIHKYRSKQHRNRSLPTLHVRKDIKQCKRPKQVGRNRVAKILHKTSELVTDESASEIFTKYIQKHYPDYHKKQQRKETSNRNKELKKIEKMNANQQFQRQVEYSLTQRQIQSQRNYLYQCAKKRKRYTTSDGTITAGHSSRHHTGNEKDKYVNSLVEDGTAFYPLMRDGTLYREYYQHKGDLIAGNKAKIGPKNNLQRYAKKGIDGCGVSIGCVRDFKSEVLKRLTQLVLDPKYKGLFAYHQSNYLEINEKIHHAGPLELCLTFDGSDTKNNRAGNSRTQAQIYYGGLVDGAAGYIYIIPSIYLLVMY
eukprot:46264_1